MVIVKSGDKAFKLLNGEAFVANENTVANAQSALLRLSPEIKARIYEYILGGKTFHCVTCACPDGRLTVAYNECHLNDMYGRNYKRFICTSDEADYYEKHKAKKCSLHHIAPRSSHHFSLVKVCQQLYAETALLPLETSTFSFWNLQSLGHFVYALQPIQQRAIRKVVVGVSCVAYTDENWALPFTTLTSLNKLSYYRRIAHDHRKLDIISEKTLKILERLPLAEVNIRVSYDLEMPPLEMKEDIEQYTKQAEQRVLRVNNSEYAHQSPMVDVTS